MCLKQPELVPLIANVPFLLAPLVPRQPTPDLWIRIVHKVYNLSLYFSTWPPFGKNFLWRNGRSCNRDLPHRVVAQDSTFCVLSGQNPKEEQLFFLKPSLRAHAGFPQIQLSLFLNYKFWEEHMVKVFLEIQWELKHHPPKMKMLSGLSVVQRDLHLYFFLFFHFFISDKFSFFSYLSTLTFNPLFCSTSGIQCLRRGAGSDEIEMKTKL